MNVKQKKISKLAREVLTLSRNTLLINLRFMDLALSRFKYVEFNELTLATDGQYLIYNPMHILNVFKGEQEAVVRDYLHVVFHCVYRHMFLHSLKDQDLWNLACDIAVEKTITDLGIRSTNALRTKQQIHVLRELENHLKIITADKIYNYYLEKGLSVDDTKELAKLFCADDHTIWYMSSEQKQKMGIGSGSGDSEDDDQDGDGGGSSQEDGESSGTGGMSAAELEQDWKDISEHMQMDLDTFSKKQGTAAGSLMQNLREVNREKYNYEEFLRRFSVRGEVMKLDMDEFDYVFYTYGLQLYGKVPLIEPLEYKEVERIKEFVIAIDTSGSTSGELVQRFIQKTYNILKSTESFFSKINLHIIQCDARIQEDAKVTSQEEFDEYLKTMKLHGFGGTDFRPVFRYVDQLIEQKEFENLKGLIYFTDGYGTFPSTAPQYDAAFVFIDDGFNNYDVPSWAIRLILQKEDI